MLLHLRFDLGGEVGVVLEIELRVLAPLPDPLLAVGVPGTGFLDDPGFGRDVHEQRLVADPLVEHDVELRLAEWRRGLFLFHLPAHVFPHHPLAPPFRTAAPPPPPPRPREFARPPPPL